jgi:pantothenate synthetase
MSQVSKTGRFECSDFMMQMSLSTVRDYLGLALSAREMNITNRCEMSLLFVEKALDLVKKLEGCLGHGR